MRALVGYSGFVGSNLAVHGNFDAFFNSKNIKDAFGTKPDILYFAGLRAEKFLANRDPEGDYAAVCEAIENIERIAPKSVALMSTVDVYALPAGVDENSPANEDDLAPYGRNRLCLERFVRERFRDHTVVRLPALYGRNIKKNFIYDMINFLPSMLGENKMKELGFEVLSKYYLPSADGFYRLAEIDSRQREFLKEFFAKAGFSALNFTDVRSSFQFYNLERLYGHTETARGLGIQLLNLASEPCAAGEVYEYIFGKKFSCEIKGVPQNYDVRTVYANKLGGANGYLSSKGAVLEDLKKFVTEQIETNGRA